MPQQLKSQRDEPGTLREYETIYILRPNANTDQIHDVNSRIKKIIEDSGGAVIKVDNWGKRKLSYEIRKQLKGIYLYWLYLGKPDLIAELERNLRMLDLVIRYYTVKVDEGVIPGNRPSQMDEESFASIATTVPDEEDAYLRRSSSADEGATSSSADEGASSSADEGASSSADEGASSSADEGATSSSADEGASSSAGEGASSSADEGAANTDEVMNPKTDNMEPELAISAEETADTEEPKESGDPKEPEEAKTETDAEEKKE